MKTVVKRGRRLVSCLGRGKRTVAALAAGPGWRWIGGLLSIGGLGGLMAGLINLPLGSQLLQIPSPEAAIQQAEQLPPEQFFQQVTQLEIDPATRDRLRFDPVWQPIVKAVQLDLMQLKWGNSQLQQPVWQRYGAKAYPLLDYYARSADPTRQAYGMLGIQALGKPYTTRWLIRQVQRRSLLSLDAVTASPDRLLAPESAAGSDFDWQRAFGLDDPSTREQLIRLAQDNLEPTASPTYDRQFNLALLIALEEGAELPAEERPTPVIPEWDRYLQLNSPSAQQVQQILTVYRDLSPSQQDFLLVEQLGQAEAGMLSLAERQFLQALAADATAPDRLWALAELDRHGDAAASSQLQTLLDGDLEQLYPLTRLAGYTSGFSSSLEKNNHAYLLLLGLTTKYPQSRFTRAAREYGNLKGASYFGGEPRPADLLQQIAQRSPAQQTVVWQNWLSRYPDHPGADDATYFIARGWQDQNQVFAALDLWVQLMTQQVGDSDAKYLAWGHLRSLLDVGLSPAQVEKLPQLYRTADIEPLFRYALAVHAARQHDYTKALQTSAGLDLTQMPASVLGSYYQPLYWYEHEDETVEEGYVENEYREQGQLLQPQVIQPQVIQPQVIQQRLQARLTEQRQRWQRLQQWQAENTPESRYQIAADWAGEGGWKNGYLGLWDERRTTHLPLGDEHFCRVYWVCDTARRGGDAVRLSYQQASQNATALHLYQQLLDDPMTPAALQEKSLYGAASTLLWQWEDHPLAETLQLHPPAGVVGAAIETKTDAFERRQAAYRQIEADYLTRLDALLAALQEQFPESVYIDDLLFSRYRMRGNRADLQQIMDRYPQGDRAAEARFLLNR
jgi:hypothetical protein